MVNGSANYKALEHSISFCLVGTPLHISSLSLLPIAHFEKFLSSSQSVKVNAFPQGRHFACYLRLHGEEEPG